MAEKIPHYWSTAKTHIKKHDAILAEIIVAYEEPPLVSKQRPFETLVHAIVGQQISAKAAEAVWQRFKALVGDVAPKNILRHEAEALRKVGLSGRKVEYIRGLAKEGAWVEHHSWDDLEDQEIKDALCALRGVGPWTADMVMIFSLLRPDILPLGDIGIIRAMEQLYSLGQENLLDEITMIAARWSPFRTVGSWYLWRYLDAEPVLY